MEDMNIMPEAPVENHEKSENTYLIPAAIIVAGLIVAGAVMYAFSPNKGAESGNTAKSGLSDTDGSFVSQNLADHDALYTRQAELAKGTMNYAALARELGMDKTAFEKCVKDRKYENEVTKDYEDGVKAGVDGTPALFINGVKVTPAGAQPFSVFQTAIEAALR